MTIKHGRLMTYGESDPPIESHDPLTTRWCLVMQQIESITDLLWQDLWQWNLASWWHMVKWTYPWSHMSLWTSGHMKSRDKLKTKYFFLQNRRRLVNKLWRFLMYGEAKPIMKSQDSDQVITKGHVSNWKPNISSSSSPIPPDLAGWWHMATESHPRSHMTLWIYISGRSHEKFKA